DEGVELRMPFYDRRLVEFVMSRPPEEFDEPGEYKALLRRAMKGHLPSRTWDPQAGGLKPGTGVGVLRSRYAREAAELIDGLNGAPWVLESLGLVDRAAFLRDFETSRG